MERRAMIQELALQVCTEHFPGTKATPTEIAAAEKRLGFHLPLDLKKFYQACNGARFFKDFDSPYRVLSLAELNPACDLIEGAEVAETETWYAFCELHDGNYLAMDLAQLKVPNAVPIIDCPHEHFGQSGHATIVAMSFTEFLIDALKSKGIHYWLGKKYDGYGDALE
jgi:hypothetical protein